MSEDYARPTVVGHGSVLSGGARYMFATSDREFLKGDAGDRRFLPTQRELDTSFWLGAESNTSRFDAAIEEYRNAAKGVTFGKKSMVDVDPAKERQWIDMAESAGIISEKDAALRRLEQAPPVEERPVCTEHSWVREPYRRDKTCQLCGAEKTVADILNFDPAAAHLDSTTGRPPQPSGDFSIGGDLWPGLSKLIEEAGEVIQVAGKLIGSEGNIAHWSGDLRDKFHEELGDLLAAIEFFVAYNDLSIHEIHARRNTKTDLFCQWHRDTAARRAAQS